jgi:hypothetical protein
VHVCCMQHSSDLAVLLAYVTIIAVLNSSDSTDGLHLVCRESMW